MEHSIENMPIIRMGRGGERSAQENDGMAHIIILNFC